MEQTERKLAIEHIYAALIERGYRPVDQLIGYILTGDPTYCVCQRKSSAKGHEKVKHHQHKIN